MNGIDIFCRRSGRWPRAPAAARFPHVVLAVPPPDPLLADRYRVIAPDFRVSVTAPARTGRRSTTPSPTSPT
ncbi:hypothetical protein NKG94_42055 [Micromonospora sp. M12]